MARIEKAYRKPGLGLGHPLLVGEAGPLVSRYRAGSLADDLLHRLHRLAGAVPGAASPWMFIAGKPLYRSSRGES